jgi:hypothetical protein
MKMAILEKQEKEKERIEQLELLKQQRIESQKRFENLSFFLHMKVF